MLLTSACLCLKLFGTFGFVVSPVRDAGPGGMSIKGPPGLPSRDWCFYLFSSSLQGACISHKALPATRGTIAPSQSGRNIVIKYLKLFVEAPFVSKMGPVRSMGLWLPQRRIFPQASHQVRVLPLFSEPPGCYRVHTYGSVLPHLPNGRHLETPTAHMSRMDI